MHAMKNLFSLFSHNRAPENDLLHGLYSLMDSIVIYSIQQLSDCVATLCLMHSLTYLFLYCKHRSQACSLSSHLLKLPLLPCSRDQCLNQKPNAAEYIAEWIGHRYIVYFSHQFSSGLHAEHMRNQHHFSAQNGRNNGRILIQLSRIVF